MLYTPNESTFFTKENVKVSDIILLAFFTITILVVVGSVMLWDLITGKNDGSDQPGDNGNGDDPDTETPPPDGGGVFYCGFCLAVADERSFSESRLARP